MFKYNEEGKIIVETKIACIQDMSVYKDGVTESPMMKIFLVGQQTIFVKKQIEEIKKHLLDTEGIELVEFKNESVTLYVNKNAIEYLEDCPKADENGIDKTKIHFGNKAFAVEGDYETIESKLFQ